MPISYDQLPQDEKLFSAASDTTWRFHTYEQYGGDAGRAIRALAKRAPGYSREIYKGVFELYLQRLAETVAAVKAAPISTKPGQTYSEYTDVDVDFVMNRLRSVLPDYPDDFLMGDVGMVINWYYLR